MRYNQRHSARYSRRSNLYLPRITSPARTILMLLLPLLLVAIPLRDRMSSAVASGGKGLTPFVAPPTNLQVVGLDTSLQVNWTPSTDPTTAWHLVSVWDGTQMQQSKVVGRTSRAAQANGVVPGRTYTVKVQAMDAVGNLSAPATVVAASDPQSPMRNAAFFDNFNEGVGDLNSDFYDVRSSQGNGQRPADVGQGGKFLVFKSEHHFHTEMLGGLERGELYIRPRVPMDLSDNGVRTFQTEFDISATQHSEGKWPEIHFVAANMVPWSGEEFGAGDGDDLSNSLEFSVRADRGSNTSNFPQISVNINGVATTFIGTTPIFTPVNVRLPVVVKMSRTFAELYINGVMVVRADGFNLPFTQGYWMLAHRSWYSGRDRVTSPVINQVVHWDMIQFDGPAGSINPTAHTYIQPGCPGIIRNDSGLITGCPVININGFTPSYTMNFNVADSVSAARSAVLRFNGWSTNGQLTMSLNGHTMTLNTATGGYQNVLNSYEVPAGWLQQGANSLVLSGQTSNDAGISEVQLESVFNIPRQMNTQLM